MLSVSFPIPIRYLDKLSSGGLQQQGGELNDHSIKNDDSFSFHCYCHCWRSWAQDLDKESSPQREIQREEENEKGGFKEGICISQWVLAMCLWSINVPWGCKRFAAMCWRYPKAAPSTQLPPVNRGPEVSWHAGLNGLGGIFVPCTCLGEVILQSHRSTNINAV